MIHIHTHIKFISAYHKIHINNLFIYWFYKFGETFHLLFVLPWKPVKEIPPNIYKYIY